MTATTMTANTAAIARSIVALLQAMPTNLITMCGTPITASGSLQTVTPTSMTNISNGTQLYVDLAAPELVTASNCTGSTFQAIFANNHTGNWTIGSNTLMYALVKNAAINDPTDVTNYAAVTIKKRKTARFDSGWKLNSEPIFAIESGADQTDAVAAEAFVMNAADALSFLAAHRYTFNNVPGVYVTLTDMDDEFAYRVYPNGRIYRVVTNYFKCLQQYNVLLNP